MIHTLFLWLVLLGTPEAQNSAYCKVFGTVYEVKSPEDADFYVYLSGSEVSADLIVFKQTNKLYADRVGMWSFESKQEFADHKIYYVDREREAHFSVYFTRFESFAGCNQ